MSWNPRRFAAVLPGFLKNHRLVWLTEAGLDRISDGVNHHALELTDEPLPDEGLVVGLASPADVEGTDLRGVVLVCAPRGGGKGFVEVRDRKGKEVINFNHHDLLRPGEESTCIPDGFALLPEKYILPDHRIEIIISVLLIRAAWTLLNEPSETEVTATVVADERVEVGKKRKARQSDISIIDIRRPTGIRYTPSGREVIHDHRWTVRGHWRNQPFGPGRQQRRRIWIDSFVCGPEDRPLRDRTKINVIR